MSVKREDSPKKPLHVKPTFYAMVYPELKEVAWKYGFNLLLHGSLHRDMDLVAVNWTDLPDPEIREESMMDDIKELLTGTFIKQEADTIWSPMPGGRRSWVINVHRYQLIVVDGITTTIDQEWYLDISVKL